MKSSRPSSAHCRSSKTRITTPFSAIRSKKTRQAANSDSRSGRSSASDASTRPSSCRRRGSIQRRSASSATHSSSEAVSFARAAVGSSASVIVARLRTISASAQKLMPSP